MQRRSTSVTGTAALMAVALAAAVFTHEAALRADKPAAKPASTTPPAACRKLPALGCVPGGYFLRGTAKGMWRNQRPQQRVWVDTFYMDQTEVTVRAYEACVRAGKCKPARTVYDDFSRPLQPKVGVSWFAAKAFCEANGKHLPTEAEWEKAARGTDGRVYPWGDTKATCKEAVIKDRRGRSCGVKKEGGQANKGRTFEVRSRKPNQFGLYDMSGNAWEWTADWYTSSYAKCGAACSKPNPRGPCDGAEKCPGRYYRVVRGGSWYYDADQATTTYRNRHYPKNKPYHHYGFRCAASTSEATALHPKR